MMKKLFSVLIGVSMVFSLTGCYELMYFRHYPTHDLLSNDIHKSDFVKLKMFVSDGVLFLPNLKPLSDSHPHPYSQLLLVSESKVDIYLCQASIRTASGHTLSSININREVSVDHPRKEGMYKSMGVKLFDATNVNITDFLNYDVLYLSIRFSRCDKNEAGTESEVVFKLEKRVTKEIAWPT